MTRYSLDDLVVPTPPYRAWRASLAVAEIEKPIASPEKPREKSPVELASDLRKEASDARAKIMAMNMSEERKQAAIARINAVLNSELAEFSKLSPPATKLPRRSPPVHGIQEPTPADLQEAKQEAAERVKQMEAVKPQPKPEGLAKVFRVGEVITQGKHQVKILEVDAKGRPTWMKEVEPEREKPEPKPEATINLPVRELQGGKKAMVTGPGSEGGERAFVYEDKRLATPPGSANRQLAEDVAETQGKGVGTGQGAGKNYPKTESKAPSSDFDIEFKQPSAEQERQEFIKKTQEQWELERQAGEARRQQQIAKREGKAETPPAPPERRGPRFNLLNDKGPPEPRVEIPPQPGMPGGAIPENLRQAAREIPVGSERVNFKPSPEMKQKLDEASERGGAADREHTRASEEKREKSPEIRLTQQELIERLAQAKQEGVAQAQQEQQEQQPPRAEGPQDRIKRIKERGEPNRSSSFFDRLGTKMAAEWQDWRARVYTVLAQREHMRMNKRDAKVKKWETAGLRMSEKGSFGTDLSRLWHEKWANYHKWRGRGTYERWQRYDDNRINRENNRDELYNQGAARIDRVRDSLLERVDQFALERDEKEKELDAAHQAHKMLTEALGEATGEQVNVIQGRLTYLEKKMKVVAQEKRIFELAWQKERQYAVREQMRKQGLLEGTVRKARPDTTPKEYPWLMQRMSRPGGSPGPREGAERLSNAKAKKAAGGIAA